MTPAEERHASRLSVRSIKPKHSRVDHRDGAIVEKFISRLPDEHYEVIRPIPVCVEPDPDGGWVARFDEAMISMPGSTRGDAIDALLADILDTYELFSSEKDSLGPIPQQQFLVLQRFVEEKGS